MAKPKVKKKTRKNGYPVAIRNTKKRKTFLGCPLGSNRSYRLPGIGFVYGRRFRDGGYQFVYRIVKRFLKLKGNEEKFVTWLRCKTGATRYHAYQCYDSIMKWCRDNRFL
ncbi:barrier-to-autointegration factor-like [Centruroides sculpturatus]|uniref:barrier-to-autointegration factor-like n=1 Tax=Centruroides sculpturatus TaxID=218467 RepID=UPI000C6D4B57|nr:barrier-to-autointegration factor-like [Centruroides sculpturatus]